MTNLTKLTTAAVVNMGCDKNLIGSEQLAYYLAEGGYCVTTDLSVAQVIIVNTCAFIESARKESINKIIELAEYKKHNCNLLIVSGCLSQKHGQELFDELVEADGFLTDNYSQICEVIDKCLKDRVIVESNGLESKTFNRMVSTPSHYAYLKIAEGCDNCCTYCTIPFIKGRYKSRSIEDIVEECRILCNQGVREVILIAQDVSRYGIDLYNQSRLIDLLRELSKLDVKWIRLMYCYPEMVTDELINEIKNNNKICKYIDVPIQHIDDNVLRLMGRKTSSSDIKLLLGKLKSNGISVRSTAIVGFPTETQQQFENLLQFAKEGFVDMLGVFAYSLEEGTAAATMKPQVSYKEKKKRVASIRHAVENVIFDRNKQQIGLVVDAVIDGVNDGKFIARSQFCAPEIDTYITVVDKKSLHKVGDFCKIKIIDCKGYDLIGGFTE